MLALSIGGISITLQDLNKFPRTRPNVATVEPNVNGASVGSGPAFEPKHIWTVEAWCDRQQFLKLQRIFNHYDLLRRQGQNCNILVWDCTEEYQEIAPRTRAIVPSRSESIEDGYSIYYAQFNAWMTVAPERESGGGKFLVTFSLTETDKVAA